MVDYCTLILLCSCLNKITILGWITWVMMTLSSLLITLTMKFLKNNLKRRSLNCNTSIQKLLWILPLCSHRPLWMSLSLRSSKSIANSLFKKPELNYPTKASLKKILKRVNTLVIINSLSQWIRLDLI